MKSLSVKLMTCFVLLIFILLPGNAISANSAVELGFTYFYFDYKEDLPPGFKSTETGWLPGVYGSYEYSKKSDVYAKLFASYAAADITFDGTRQDGVPITFSDSRQRFFKFEGNIGYNLPAGDRASLIPFTGYGYRYWERGQTRTTPSFSEVQEDYSWSYIPVGIRLDYTATDKLSLGLAAQANFMFNGKMRIPAYDADFDLGNKVGFYVEAPIRYHLTYNWFLSLTPWYEYSQIGQSNVVIGLYEPSSRTHWYGFNVGAGYSF